MIRELMDRVWDGLEVIGETVPPVFEKPEDREKRMLKIVAKGFLDPSFDRALNGGPIPTGLIDAWINHPGIFTATLNTLSAAETLKRMAGPEGVRKYDTPLLDEIARQKGYASFGELKERDNELFSEIESRMQKFANAAKSREQSSK